MAYPSSHGSKIITWLLPCVCFLFLPFCLNAQCSNWTLSATNIKPSECVANGSFSVALAGTDLANLTNIQYSIPLTQGGFSVLANSSPHFSNIPPGTFTVKVDATCNSANVSKTTTVTIGGSYAPPTL